MNNIWFNNVVQQACVLVFMCACVFPHSGLQCTNEGQRIWQKWQPYPEKLLTPLRYVSALMSLCCEVIITPVEGVRSRGLDMKAEVQLVLSEIICSITDVAICNIQCATMMKSLERPHTNTTTHLPDEIYSTTSTLICSETFFCWSETFPVHRKHMDQCRVLSSVLHTITAFYTYVALKAVMFMKDIFNTTLKQSFRTKRLYVLKGVFHPSRHWPRPLRCAIMIWKAVYEKLCMLWAFSFSFHKSQV